MWKINDRDISVVMVVWIIINDGIISLVIIIWRILNDSNIVN